MKPLNWQQIFTVENPVERKDQTRMFCDLIRAKSRSKIQYYWISVRNRVRVFDGIHFAKVAADLAFAIYELWKAGIGKLVKGRHYIGRKQVTYTITPLAIYLINFVSVLAIITTFVLLGSEQMLPAYGVLFMLTFECILLTTLVIKPWRRWRPAY